MKRLSTSLLVVVLAVAAVWLIGNAAGFELSLFWSLLISVGLTLLFNLGVLAFGSRHTGRRV